MLIEKRVGAEICDQLHLGDAGLNKGNQVSSLQIFSELLIC